MLQNAALDKNQSIPYELISTSSISSYKISGIPTDLIRPKWLLRFFKKLEAVA
jgi:hypothetical protein